MYYVGEIFKKDPEEFNDLKEAKGHAMILSWGDCVVAIWEDTEKMPICLILGSEAYYRTDRERYETDGDQ